MHMTIRKHHNIKAKCYLPAFTHLHISYCGCPFMNAHHCNPFIIFFFTNIPQLPHYISPPPPTQLDMASYSIYCVVPKAHPSNWVYGLLVASKYSVVLTTLSNQQLQKLKALIL
uniref:Uncharacterized protein n=1 Tax=Octopus bimaculoides TaxID=37653 RepID=A0A0L8IBD4_OCTBM